MKDQFIFLGLMALVASALSTSCAPKKGQVSRLWSERTAADFTSALKRGRSIAETSKSAQGGTNLAAASTFAGLTPSALAYDTDGVLVTKASFDTRKADASVAASGLTAFAQKLIEKGSSDLGVSVSEIKFLDAETIRMGSWITLRFGRVISSIPVRDARIDVTFLEKAGRFYLAEITNRGWGKSEEKGQSLSTPLTESQLAGVTGVKDLRIISSGVQYIPVQQSDGSAKLLKSNFYKVGSKSSELEYTLTFSGASEPTLVEAYSNRVEETIMAEAYVRSWVDGATTLVPLADATYRSSSGNAETIDKDGNVAALDPNGSVQLTGKMAHVIPGEGKSLSTIKLKQEGGKTVADVTDSNRPEINAYAGIVRIKKIAAQYLTDSDTGFFNETLKITTNIAQTCNAFYQGSTLNFFAKGGECANTALINDVVLHEWGHGLDDFTGPGTKNGGGITDGAFSEGIGDIIAFMYSGQSNMAEGFFTAQPKKGIRNADNTLRYTGVKLGVHEEGTIIGGAFWELRRRMINKYGSDKGAKRAEELFYKHLPSADNYRASYDIVQRLADDDGNPATKGPDFCLINHAFAKKALTKEDPCTDDFDADSGGGDGGSGGSSSDDLYLAIVSESASGVIFESSNSDARVVKMGICRGVDCSTSEVSMSFKGARGDRRIFSSGDAFAVGAESHTLLGFDSSGTVIVKRVVTIKKN